MSNPKKDKGNGFSYYNISHKRRLKRALFLTPFVILLPVGTQFLYKNIGITVAVAITFGVIFTAQLLYEYKKYKKEKSKEE